MKDKNIESKMEELWNCICNKIKNDLLEIADKGEYEDMRREVENYFELK